MIPHTVDMFRVLPELVWCGFGVLLMLIAAVSSRIVKG